jgi:hypothetical protein
MSVDPHNAVPARSDIRRHAMTTGWIAINVVLAVTVSALVAGLAVLVPHRLHRHAMRNDARYARLHAEPAVRLSEPATRAPRNAPQRRSSTQRDTQAA